MGTFGAPLSGLNGAELQAFADGLEEFQNQETVDGGLGPIFNHTSCSACHGVPTIGGSSVIKVTRFGRINGGAFDALPNLGGSLLQSSAIDPAVVEVIPAQANIMALRQSTPLFGLGLIEAIDDATIVDNAAHPKVTNVHGKPAWVLDVATNSTRVGRFGWKAQVASLLAFAGDAYVNEMGVTNRFFAQENSPNGDAAKLLLSDHVADPEDQVDPATGKGDIDHAADFMRMLAPPPRLTLFGSQAEIESAQGEYWFAKIGCGDCHTPSMTTGASVVAALSHKAVHLYSDLLLHDMGSLADGIAQGSASGKQMKTPPLWGVRMSGPYLHDGRANTLEDAILAHQGEGSEARDGYQKLCVANRKKVIAFLKTL